MSEKLERDVFGTTKDGETVYRVEIKGGGLTAKIMTWGAVIQDLRLDGHDAPLLLGFDDFASYPSHSSYFGATPGRCANRIGGGKFTLDGKAHQLELNEKGVSHLHGGSDNIAKRNWTIVEHDADRVVLKIVDPDRSRRAIQATARSRRLTVCMAMANSRSSTRRPLTSRRSPIFASTRTSISTAAKMRSATIS